MKKLLVDDVQTLVEFVATKLKISKKESKRLVDTRAVFVNGKRVWMGKHKLMIGDQVEVIQAEQRNSAGETLANNTASKVTPKLNVIFQAGDALVIDKRAGIECVNGAGHIEQSLRETWPNARVVHRLDRDTSGCLLATTTEAAWEFFIAQFREQHIHKRYLAIFFGELRYNRTVVDAALDGKSAKTIFLKRAVAAGVTLCEIELLTGRTHQIRRHAQELGCSILGDRKYGPQAMSKSLRTVPRQLLHAWKLGFTPQLGLEKVEVTAEIPADFQAWQKRLRLQLAS